MKSNKKPVRKRIMVGLTITFTAIIAFIGFLIISIYLGMFGTLPTAEDIV